MLWHADHWWSRRHRKSLTSYNSTSFALPLFTVAYGIIYMQKRVVNLVFWLGIVGWLGLALVVG